MNLPHAPYLVMMAIGEFKKVTDTPWKGKEISYYVEPEYEPYAKAIFANTYKMIDFFSKKLNLDFPWPKYSQIIVRDYVSGAMENTSATLHGEFLYQTDKDTIGGVKKESVIAHELFHQWFGDLVTCESWSNLPLNESFATYGEYLWLEYSKGRDVADEHHYYSKQGYIQSPVKNNNPLIRFFYNDKEEMFDNISYNKGGQVLHMLRKLVGDEAFFQSLHLYLTQNKFKTAEIHHLRLAFEEITGQDLNWFFNQWFMYPGHPTLLITKNYDESTKTLQLHIQQKQPNEYPIYRLPLYVDIYTSKTVNRQFIDIQQAKQTFTFTIHEKPLLVNFDAERQLLADINYQKTEEEYLYQLEHAPLWEDRYEALNALNELTNKSEKIYHALIHKALKDKYPSIRITTIEYLKPLMTSNEDLKKQILEIAQYDPHPKVRAHAIQALATLPPNEQITTLCTQLLHKEQSSQTISACLHTLYKMNPTLALEYTQKFENEKSKNILLTIATIYAESNQETHWEFFKKHLPTFTGFESYYYIGNLNKYLKKINHSGTAIAAAKTLLTYYKNSEQTTQFPIKKTIIDLTKVWVEKEKNLKDALHKNQQNNEPTKDIEDQLHTVSETVNTLQQITNSIK